MGRFIKAEGRDWEVLNETETILVVKAVESDEVRNLSKAETPYEETVEAVKTQPVTEELENEAETETISEESDAAGQLDNPEPETPVDA